VRTRLRALALAAAALGLAGRPLRADKFEDSLNLAKANAATPAGREFEQRVAERFDEAKLRDALLTCAASAREEDTVPFVVLLELGTDGRASQVLLRPPVPVAVCLRWTIRETPFPRAPKPGYWVMVDVSPRRAPGVLPIPTPGVATATIPPTRTPAAPQAAAEAAVATPPSPSPPAIPPRSVPIATPAPRASATTTVPTFPDTPRPVASAATETPLPTGPAPSGAVVDFTAGAEGFHVDERRPRLATLRHTLMETRARFIGPVLAQSDGIAPDDPRLEPYWSLAEELNLPVVLPLGRVDRDEAGAKYRVALGDPLKLESVLVRHPRLTIIVSGAAWPFADAMTGLMWRYPRVFADTGGIAWALTSWELDGYLARLVGAGLKEQILFASGGTTPKRIAKAVEAIRKSEFLPAEAKELILHGNAERLLAVTGSGGSR
jgi:hypothetical protein